ncbi:MAG TPA: CRISPR-associated protein Cas5 [Pyrinomonadaceae bacterium]|jgi:CRISPR-associated protein Cas5t
MNTFWLKIHAPFAAFRGFQAGVYRSTAPVMPPAAAYGLVLNLAGIEMRDYSNPKTTEILKDLPTLRLAIGVFRQPEKSSTYQQLHSYPVGNSGKELAALTKGAKFWITPVRREMLVDYVGVIGVQTDNATLQEKVEKGLCGEIEREYGLPFAGDNNFLFDKIEIFDNSETLMKSLEDESLSKKIIWYVQHQSDDKQVKGSCRLYVGINRTDNSKTTSSIFVPKEDLNLPLPENAWTWTPQKTIHS